MPLARGRRAQAETPRIAGERIPGQELAVAFRGGALSAILSGGAGRESLFPKPTVVISMPDSGQASGLPWLAGSSRSMLHATPDPPSHRA